MLEVTTDDGVTGWGECVAAPDPLYSHEFNDAALLVWRDFLVPRVLGRDLTAEDVPALIGPVRGHPMARGALELAILDAQLRASRRVAGGVLRVDRAPRSPAASRSASRTTTRSTPSWPRSHGYIDDGYQRVKLKIQPGWDIVPTRLMREHVAGDPAAGRRQPGLLAPRHRPPVRPRRVRPAPGRAADPRGGLPRAQAARRAHAYAGLPRRVGALGRQRREPHRLRRLRDREHQGRSRGRLPQRQGDPRHGARPRGAGVVRRHGRDRPRPRGQRRSRVAARLHAARRHQRLGPLLHAGPHGAVHHRRRDDDRADRARPGVEPIPEILAELRVSQQSLMPA